MFISATSASNINRPNQQPGHIWILQVVTAYMRGDETRAGPASPTHAALAGDSHLGFGRSVLRFPVPSKKFTCRTTGSHQPGCDGPAQGAAAGPHGAALVSRVWPGLGAQLSAAQGGFGRARLHGSGLNCQPRVAPGITQTARSRVRDNTPVSAVLTDAIPYSRKT